MEKSSIHTGTKVMHGLLALLNSAVMASALWALYSSGSISESRFTDIREAFNTRTEIINAFADFSSTVRHSACSINAELIKNDNAESAEAINSSLAEIKAFSVRLRSSASILILFSFISGGVSAVLFFRK